VRIYAVNYSGKEIYNLGIDDIKVNTQIFEKEKPVNFTVTITNYSKQNISNVPVSLFVNNERVSQVSINLGTGESKNLNVDAVIRTTGFINAFAEIEDDEILQDNRRYATLFIPEKIPIIIFTDNPSDSKFIELALTAAENQNTFVITKKNLSELSAYDLKRYELVVVVGSQNLNAADKLKRYIYEGGSLLLSPGSQSTQANYANLLAEIDLPQAANLIGKTGDPSNAFFFDKVELNHPVFKDVFINKEKTKIESPEIYAYFKISTQGRGRSIISMQDGSSFLSEYKVKSGKVFLLSSSQILTWGNFPLKSIFVPFINKSALYLASKDKSEINHLAGSIISIDLRGKSVAQLKILKPDVTEDFLPIDQTNPGGFVKYDKSNLTGNYKVMSESKVIEMISVNADPLESRVEYLDKSEIENYLNEINFKGKFFMMNKDENINEAILKARFGSELWKHFLIAALLFAFVEMLVARNAKKDLIEVRQ
jgi:hypothetical protein